jgi:hypothetical protein
LDINVKIIARLAAKIMFVLSKLENVIAYLTLMVKLVRTVYLDILVLYVTRYVPIIVKTIHVEEPSETVQKDVNQQPCLAVSVKNVLLENIIPFVRKTVLIIV